MLDSITASQHILMHMKRLTVDLSDDVHKRLKIYCATEGLDMTEVLRKLIEEHLRKVEKKKSKSKRAGQWL